VTLDPRRALGDLPEGLRDELLLEFDKITRNFREARWEAAELNGGRFCEIVYSILKGRIDGGFPTTASKPARFADACKALEQTPKDSELQSVRVGIPRVLVALYEVRNNRGVGHVGGEVDSNHMDATFVLHSVQWVMAELVRIFHDTDTVTAAAIVNSLVDRTVPLLWQVGDVTRILDPSLPLRDQTLLLAYAAVDGVHESQLASNLEQPRLDNYRRVLSKLHGERLVEYNRSSKIIHISPKGQKDVEERLLPNLAM
jgi:hypothetical protein